MKDAKGHGSNKRNESQANSTFDYSNKYYDRDQAKWASTHEQQPHQGRLAKLADTAHKNITAAEQAAKRFWKDEGATVDPDIAGKAMRDLSSREHSDQIERYADLGTHALYHILGG